LIDIPPNFFFIGMENMGAVFVNIDALLFFRVYIAANMGTPVDHKAFFPIFSRFVRKHGRKETGTNQKIIVRHLQ
jgi:hypothetical protein